MAMNLGVPVPSATTQCGINESNAVYSKIPACQSTIFLQQ